MTSDAWSISLRQVMKTRIYNSYILYMFCLSHWNRRNNHENIFTCENKNYICIAHSVKPFCFWIREHHVFHWHLRNRKHFPCFHTVLETRVEVWENEKLKWEHKPVVRVFQRNSKFSQTFTSVSITVCKHGEMFSISFIK